MKTFVTKSLKNFKKKEIQCKAYFSPCIHLQPFYQKQYNYNEGDFPISEEISKKTIILPFHHLITEKEINIIKNTLQKIIEKL